MATRAFIVGIERYADPRNNLIGVSRDVSSTVGILNTFGISDLEVIKDENAKKQSIETGLGNLLKQTGPGDVAVFYYSGHGVMLTAEDTGSADPDGQDEALVPFECDTGNLIVDNKIKEALDKNLNPGAFFYGIYDCCHSGDIQKNLLLGSLSNVMRHGMSSAEVQKSVTVDQLIFTGRPSGRAGPSLVAQAQTSKKLIVDDSRVNAVHIAACEPENTALVLNIDGERRSVFTWALEQVLRPETTVSALEIALTAKQATKTRHHKPFVTCHSTQRGRNVLR